MVSLFVKNVTASRATQADNTIQFTPDRSCALRLLQISGVNCNDNTITQAENTITQADNTITQAENTITQVEILK